jgi:acetyl-CoA C-acetyltransferase
LSIRGKAYLAGVYEHPTRHAPDKSTAQLHAEVAKGALEDAGLTKADIDGYFCAGDAPGGVMAMVDYLGLKVRHFDSTDTGGCSYLVHLGHAAEAIAAGKCSIALITLAGKPRTGAMPPRATGAELDFEAAYGATTHNVYGMCAMRHMHEYGTTSEQLAWIKVAASHHAQYNPHAMLRDVVTVEDVINSPMISDPLHRMDCCVVTDGGGGLCNNHPVNRGGMTKVIEAVRQLRGEAHPKVQVPNCDLAIAHGTGGLLGIRHAASTCILERV